MATGDMTIIIQVEGEAAKTATIPSAVLVNALTWLNRSRGSVDVPNFTNATWSAYLANNAATTVVNAAEKQLIQVVAPSSPTFTAAT